MSLVISLARTDGSAEVRPWVLVWTSSDEAKNDHKRCQQGRRPRLLGSNSSMVVMDHENGGGLLCAWQHHQVTDSYPDLHVRAGIMFEACTCKWWGRPDPGVPRSGADNRAVMTP